MYLVARHNEQLFTSNDFRHVYQFCSGNKCIRPGFHGCTRLNVGVEIWKIKPWGVELIKSWRDNASKHIQ